MPLTKNATDVLRSARHQPVANQAQQGGGGSIHSIIRHHSMKSIRSFFLTAAMLCVMAPINMSAANSDAQIVYCTAQSVTGTAGTTFATIASLTTIAVNTATNNYTITAIIKYDETMGVDNQASFQITVDGTAVAASITNVRGSQGFVVIKAVSTNIAISKVIALQAKVANAADTLKISASSNLSLIATTP